ncbi:MAG: GIY-YIG nuclease family protein [Candidatus Cloacimonadota bacterium]|nr:GIY-YIG nuclease family protein [Candidatus Cloacimonadota bacterium]
MKYVYLIRSKLLSDRYYTGITDNVDRRLSEHNHGKSPHTAKSKPWELVCFTAFVDEKRASEFEKYLKTGSGRAFSNRHFR